MENKVIKEINGKLDLVLSKLDSMENRQDGFEKKLEQFEKKQDQFEEKLEDVDRRVINVELTIENEIRPNIQLLAEGYSAFMRKNDELAKVKEEHDFTKIRLDVLESRVNRLEEKVS